MFNMMLLTAIFLPIVVGTGLLVDLLFHKEKHTPSEEELKKLHIFVISILGIAGILALLLAWMPGMEKSLTLLTLMKGISISFHIDVVGAIFLSVSTVVWFLVCIYAFGYMKHEGKEQRFFGFYLIVYGVLVALMFAGNLVTMYLFFELMTLTSMPMVLHNESREAIMAALKYLFYSMFGAYCGLFGIFVFAKNCLTLDFVAGGSLNPLVAHTNATLILVATLFCLIGFGVKAGMFPMHAWLPTAHPIAPSPASAVLSAIIVKSGVLLIVRVVFYIVGADFLRGTWVQYTWMCLALLTVFMGSMLAFREKTFKKRLAYSTVSQVSYILFGFSTLTMAGFVGAMLHVVFHAIIKAALFMTAGSFIFMTHKTQVDDFVGYGKVMGKTLWGFTFASLGLIGIPPCSGFISKWYLAEGGLTSNVGILGVIGVAVLLISALLTAGYLLPVTVRGFLPGKLANEEALPKKEAPAIMWMPIATLACANVILGLFPGMLIELATKIAGILL